MILVEDVVKEYQTRSGPVRILDHVNLRVEPGQQLGILGRNGAGKSTMIRLISGTELPTSGSGPSGEGHTRSGCVARKSTELSCSSTAERASLW